MRFLSKTVLTWLLMLSIPMQGFAASGMLLCAPNHHGVASAMTALQISVHASKVSAHQDANQSFTHQQDRGVVKTLEISNATDNLGINKTTPQTHGKPSDGKCSVCAHCCIGSSLVGICLINSVATTGLDLIPVSMESFLSFVPEGFDPPPRSHLA